MLPQALYSIGYEGRSLDEFVSTLKLHAIKVVIDVRQNAISRKSGFSKNSLRAYLEQHGIDYRHEPLLGNPKENRGGFHSQHPGDAKAAYVDRLNNASKQAFDSVIDLAARSQIALLCFERDEQHCHRSCIIERARAENPGLLTLRL